MTISIIDLTPEATVMEWSLGKDLANGEWVASIYFPEGTV